MARPSKNSKPMSNAERQRQYRMRKKLDIAAREYRLNTFINTDADTHLRMLSSHFGLSQKATIEKLLKDSFDSITDTMESGSPEWKAFFQHDNKRSDSLV